MPTNQNQNGVDVVVVEVFGIPIVRKYVQNTNSRDLQRFGEPTNFGRWIMRGFMFLMSISMLFVLTTGIVVMYYPPPMLHDLADSLIAHATGRMRMDESVMEELERKVNESEKLRLEAIESLGKCEKNKETLVNHLDEKKTELKEVNGILELLKTDLAKSVKNEEIWNRNGKQLRTTVATLREQLKDKDIKLDESKGMIETLENKFQQSETLTSILTAETKQKSDQIVECNKARGNMNQTIERMSIDEKELQKKLRDLQQDYSKQQAELNQTKTALQKIPKFMKRIEDLNRTLEAEKEKKINLTKDLGRQQASLTNCKNENTVHEDDKKKLETDIAELEKKKSDLEKNLAQEKKELEVVKKNLKSSQLSYGACQKTNHKHETTNADLLDQISSLKKQVEKC